MKVYQVKAGEGLVTHLVPLDVDLQNYLSAFSSAVKIGKRVPKSWRPPRVEVLTHSRRPPHKKLTQVDVMSFCLSYYAFNEHSISFLRGMLEKTGELIQMSSFEHEFYLYHSSRPVDALQKDRDDYRKYEFTAEVITDVDVFFLPKSPRLFVSDRFKKVCDENNITGLMYSEVWSSDSGARKYWLDKDNFVLSHL